MDERSPTILCVDDDREVLGTLADYLTGQGYRVITATNGVEAFLQAWRQRPRAVILDLFMPRLGGLGALDRIRRLDASTVVVLISGVENALEMIREAGLNVAGVLAKPFEPSALLEVLLQAGVVPEVPAARLAADSLPDRPVRRRILVVDDDPEVRETLVEYLERKGFDVVAAGNGEEALRRCAGNRLHMVLLDIQMPGLSGVETLKRIKALPQETCVVMVSGQGDEKTARQTLAAGAADYITKPVDFTYLDSVLDMHLLMAQFEPDASTA